MSCIAIGTLTNARQTQRFIAAFRMIIAVRCAKRLTVSQGVATLVRHRNYDKSTTLSFDLVKIKITHNINPFLKRDA